MRRIIFGALVASVLFSCAEKEESAVDSSEMTANGGVEVVLRVSSEQYESDSDSPDTKVAISDAGAFSWSADDSFYLGGGQFGLQSGSGSASASFKGQVTSALKDGDVAICPSDGRNSDTQVKIPALRTWGGNNAYCPMIGSYSSTGKSVSFTHLGGVVKVTLKNVPAGAAQFVFNTPGYKINGPFDITGTGSGRKISTVASESNDTYKLNFTALAAASSSMTFYVPLPTGTYSNGFTIKIKDSAGNLQAQFVGHSSQTVKRARLIKMPVIDVNDCLPVKLRVFDFNVGRFSKNGGSFDTTAPKVAEIINANNADVICLQELDSLHTTDRYQLNALKRITPPNTESNVGSYWKIFFGSNITYAKGSYGVGIMWKNSLGKPVDQFHTRLAKEDGLEVRGVATVEFAHFVIMCAHLDNQSTDARQHQMTTIKNLAVNKYQNSHKLVILTGDFNGVIGGGVDNIARQAFTRVSSDDPTAPASTPKNNPDMMYVLNNGMKYTVNYKATLGSKLMCNYAPSSISDHRPILVELEFFPCQ